MKGIARRLGIWAGMTAAFWGACRGCPGFARFMLDRVSRPAMALLHRLTAGVPFPVAEAGLIALAGAMGFGLIAGAVRSLVHREIRPLARWLAGTAGVALALVAALVALWVPARALPGEALPEADGAHLERLCESLITELNASALAFPEALEALRLAPEVAWMAGCAVKAARYPEWMDAARAWGLFVPLTGEALVNAAAPGPLVPFTAVHELTHLTGIADEGAANVAAWERCAAAGGAFADSARLWALRYALGLLRARDGEACRRAEEKMNTSLQSAFWECGGEIVPEKKRSGILAGFSLSSGDYGDLARYLALSMPKK